MLLRQLLTTVTETTDPTAAQGVEAHGYVYNKRDQREHWSKKFKSEQAAKAWADAKNATILSIRPVQAKSQNRNTLESKLAELSPATLASYKKKAGADASASDKRGDYARGNKRMSGIVRATKKEFDNDSKSVAEGRVDSPVSSAITRRILDQRPGLLKYGPQAVMYAVDQVAEWVGNVEDFEPSDVSEWVNQVSRYLQTQAGQGVAEGVRDLGYDAQSLIMKLRRDVEEKRIHPTPQAVLAAARELAGDMDFAPQLLVKQVLGQGVAEGSGPEERMSVDQALEIARKNNSSFSDEDYWDLVLRNEGLGASFFNNEVMSAIQKKQGVAEGVALPDISGLGYNAQSLIMKLRRDVEEKRLQPTPQAVLAAARELAGDMKFAPQLLVKQVLGQGVAEGDDIGYHQTSGTKAGHTISSRKLSNKPQASKSDVTLQSGSMHHSGKSYNFPKGTLFTQLPGGIFAKHPSVPETHPGYGHLIRRSEDNIHAIHNALNGQQGVAEGLNEFSPAGGGIPPRGPKSPGRDPWGGDDGPGEDPYKYPQPEHYSRSIDFFGQFEAGHFDDEVLNDATGEFRGYWNNQEGRDQIAYFKFDNPRRTGDNDPGMGWYYEPQNESVAESEYNHEYDDEAGMAQSNLVTSARAVKGLLDTIKDRDNLPEWVQEKIAKAEMMLVSVWDYLQSQKELGMDPKIKESNKIKGADGKACWKGHRYAGTENSKDKCVPVGEDVENIMGALIENLIRK